MEKTTARILPQRADEGDPEGARRRGRQGRNVRAGGAHQEDQADQGGPRQGDGRVEEAAPDVADVRGGDGRAQLSRLVVVDSVAEALEGQKGPSRGPNDPGRRSFRPRQGQGADRRISRRAAARQQADGPDSVPCRPSGRRQDFARQVHRQGDGPRVRAHVARRRARRSGDPRTPAHLYRLDARQGHPVDAQGQVVESALPRSTRSTRWAWIFRGDLVFGLARSARPGAELDLQRPLPPRSNTTSRT